VRHSAKAVARQEKERQVAAHSAHAADESHGPGSWLLQVPYALALVGVGAGLLWMRGGERDVRGGTLVIAGVLLVAAAARLGLPARRAGLLGTRRRLVDVAAFCALGVGLLVAGLVFPAPV
jgi:Protein of unknown function (DUF3017)